MRQAKRDTTQSRVNFACAVMLRGGNTTRNFDSCLENEDNHHVAAGIWKRALKNPKLMAIMPRYFNAQMMQYNYNQTKTQIKTPNLQFIKVHTDGHRELCNETIEPDALEDRIAFLSSHGVDNPIHTKFHTTFFYGIKLI